MFISLSLADLSVMSPQKLFTLIVHKIFLRVEVVTVSPKYSI